MKLKSVYLLTLLVAGLLALAGGLQAADEAPPAAADAGKPAIHNKTLMEQIKEGGWVMFPIFGLSVFTLYLVVDGVLRTGPKKAMPAQHVEAVRSLFRQGDYVAAYKYCKENPSPFTNVCRTSISLLGDGKAVVEDGMFGELAKENSTMQTYISYLSVVGVCAPMVGLLGTVTGMIGAFAVLGSTGIGDPAALSGKIGEVLVATASGLIIAIPAFGAYYYLRNRAAKVLHDIQDTMNGLLRKMPYDQLQGAHLGDEELYAATPNWVAAPGVAADINA